MHTRASSSLQKQSRDNNSSGPNRALVHAPQYGNFDIIGPADRQDLTHRESSSFFLSLFFFFLNLSCFKLAFHRPMRYKRRSIFTKRGAIYHPRAQLARPALPDSFLFLLARLLFARVVSRPIAFPDAAPGSVQPGGTGFEIHPLVFVSIHLHRDTRDERSMILIVRWQSSTKQ